MFVIEHLEPRLFRWCLIEYKHISEIVGRDQLIFANVESEKLRDLGQVEKQSVNDMNLQKCCVLDPFAKEELTTSDKFDYYVFGGILGDEPMQGRTEKELTLKGVRRHIGKEQMSTDTAVYVVKHIIEGGNMSDLSFQDEIEIDIKEGESIILPFRYVVESGEPVLAPGLLDFLRTRKGF